MNFARTSVTTGALLTVAMRWADRAVGFVSVLLLARLLTPADIGIIAMASLVIGLADMLLDLGVHVPLIRNPRATQAHYDTAWTLRLIQTGLATALLVWAAPHAADYFGDPRVQPVLQILAFSLVLGGFENIGVIAFHKEMQFGAEFRFRLIRRLTGFAVTISAAWLLRSYWALVLGTLTGAVLGVTLSYLMHPMRPRFGLSKLGEILAISQWMLVRGIGEYLHQNLHRILVGRWASAATLGAYTLANEIASMPSTELLAPMNRALFPAMAKAQADPSELQRLFLLALGVQAMVAIPAALGLALVAAQAVPLLLGDKWLEAIPLLQLLALVGVAQALTAAGSYVMLVLGKMVHAALVFWGQVLLFVLLILLVLPGAEAATIAALRLAAALASIALSLWLLRQVFPIVRLGDLVAVTYRPLIAALGMALSLVAIDHWLVASPLVLIVVKMFAGAVVYSLVVLLSWRSAKLPSGAEAWLFAKINGYASI